MEKSAVEYADREAGYYGKFLYLMTNIQFLCFVLTFAFFWLTPPSSTFSSDLRESTVLRKYIAFALGISLAVVILSVLAFRLRRFAVEIPMILTSALNLLPAVALIIFFITFVFTFVMVLSGLSLPLTSPIHYMEYVRLVIE